MTTAIKLDHVTKTFPSFRPAASTTLKDILSGRKASGHQDRRRFAAVQDVSLEVRTGSVLGIIGSNGAGKSTLLKLVAGIYRPTSGSVCVNGRVSALLSLGVGFHPDLTFQQVHQVACQCQSQSGPTV